MNSSISTSPFAPATPDAVPPELAQLTQAARDGARQALALLPVLGHVTWLMLQQGPTRNTLLGDLEWRVLPPLMLKQARLHMRDEAPLAYVSWALLSADAATRYRAAPHRLAAADRHHAALLQRAQQLRLQRQRHVADFVEEQRAAVGFAEFAGGAVAARAGVGAGAVAEQFGFDQAGRDRRAVDGDEGAVAARPAVMKGLGEDFLAGAGFALDQQRDVEADDALGAADGVGDGLVAQVQFVEGGAAGRGGGRRGDDDDRRLYPDDDTSWYTLKVSRIYSDYDILSSCDWSCPRTHRQ